MKSPAHRLLSRQIRKSQDANGQFDLSKFLLQVNETYNEQERDLIRIDRANNLMAEELEEMFAIRERANAAELARQASDASSAAKSRFLANISHELRTPLNAIIGFTELIAEDAAEQAPSVAADAGQVLKAAHHLLKLINEVLNLSKIESGHVDTELTVFDVQALAEDVIDTMAPAAHVGGVKLELDCVGVGDAFTDPFRVKQCLLNLVSNAIKFSPGGAVTVAVRRTQTRQGPQIEFVIADTGIGMTEEQLQGVFRPFQQADSSITQRFGGTGLGLSIARGLAQALDGDISANSTLGQGSVFVLSLPAEFNAGAAAPLALSA